MEVCEECETELYLDHNYKGDYIIATLICPNENCRVREVREYSRTDTKEIE